MSMVIKKRSPEEVAAFFKKNKWSIDRLLGDIAPKKKKTKRKKRAASKKKKQEVAAAECAPEAAAVPVVEETPAPVIEAPVVEAPVEETAAPDDLTKLDGLGAKMAENLAAVGITTYADLAALTKKKSERVGEGIRGFLSKFEKKKWRQQAKDLMKG